MLHAPLGGRVREHGDAVPLQRDALHLHERRRFPQGKRQVKAGISVGDFAPDAGNFRELPASGLRALPAGNLRQHPPENPGKSAAGQAFFCDPVGGLGVDIYQNLPSFPQRILFIHAYQGILRLSPGGLRVWVVFQQHPASGEQKLPQPSRIFYMADHLARMGVIQGRCRFACVRRPRISRQPRIPRRPRMAGFCIPRFRLPKENICQKPVRSP